MTSSKSAEHRPAELPQLTSLRFFAALGVLFSHLIFLREIDNPLKSIAVIFFGEGHSGVTFFFVLSGFIMTHAYQHSLTQKTLPTKKYLFLRIARIWPLHVITALPFVFYFFYKGSEDFLKIITVNVLLLQSWVPSVQYYMSLNAVSWSLSVELFFYIGFIYLVRLSVQTLQKTALLWFLVIAAAAAGMIFYGHGNYSDGQGGIHFSHWMFYINPVVRLLDFMIGILIYKLTFNTNKPNSTVLEIFAVCVLLIGVYIYSTFALPEILRAQLLYLPLMALMIYAFSNGTGLLSRLLKTKSLILLGEASFSLYLIHNPIISLANLIFLKASLNIPLVLYAILLTIVCVIASVLTYKLIEKPTHNFLKKRINAF